MQLRLHHIEMCVKDPNPILKTLCQQFGLNLVGQRQTPLCDQYVVKLGRTTFVITSRIPIVEHGRENTERISSIKTKKNPCDHSSGIEHTRRQALCEQYEHENEDDPYYYFGEPWTTFCCVQDKQCRNGNLTVQKCEREKVTEEGENWRNGSVATHVDSVFNVAIEIQDLTSCVNHLKRTGCSILQDVTVISADKGYSGSVRYAIIKSCCGFQQVQNNVFKFDGQEQQQASYTVSHFDHIALACHTGQSNSVIEWYENAFGMKRFINTSQETEEDGIVIGEDVGMRLKVLEFWKCSEVGLASIRVDKESTFEAEDPREVLKIVVVESLPLIKNTQIESFIRDHGGPGLQHIALHTSNIIATVSELTHRGVRFRFPPPTYYTDIGQLNSIKEVGEDPANLSKYGILLDQEIFDTDDTFNSENPIQQDPSMINNETRYLMQIFTYPIFDRDTFFLEVIQRKGAQGFGVGNVTALARSVNAYQKLKDNQKKQQLQENNYQ